VIRTALVLLMLACPVVARAQGVASAPATLRLNFDGYRGAWRVMSLTLDLTFGPGGYRVAMSGRTRGLAGWLYGAEWRAAAEGVWSGGAVAPSHYENAGVFGGKQRHVALQYVQGSPVVLALQPADDGEHEPVPPDLERGSVDGLSLLAMAIHQVATAGGCGGQLTTFDGWQIETRVLRPAGADTLANTSRSPWSGAAQRCDIASRVIAGFNLGHPEASRRPYVDSLWFASVRPGVPPLPVRLTATTLTFGVTLLYLTDATVLPAGTLASAQLPAVGP
jgi:hypothetical protein